LTSSSPITASRAWSRYEDVDAAIFDPHDAVCRSRYRATAMAVAEFC